MNIRVIVTIPPYASFLREIASHPLVCGFRLNTVMPLAEEPQQALERLLSYGQPLWVDLKGRQLRVVGAAIPPYTEIQLSHPIRLNTPANAFLSDGLESLEIAAVDGNRLILGDGPHRLIGPGESVNIIDPSLEIEGTLTETDRSYLSAMRRLELKQVMLSYVETPADPAQVLQDLPGAEMILKIENRKGIEFARKYGCTHGHLMAARGDLYVEVPRPHAIISALRDIITADPQAVAASRIFDSLIHHPVPACADITDLAFLLSLGYRTFMLGDAQCMRRELVLESLNLLKSIAGQF